MSVPRTRGDEPARHVHRRDEIAFPARAGMNRHDQDSEQQTHSVPRTRGDEPVRERPLRRCCDAFPARAGMNR